MQIWETVGQINAREQMTEDIRQIREMLAEIREDAKYFRSFMEAYGISRAGEPVREAEKEPEPDRKPEPDLEPESGMKPEPDLSAPEEGKPEKEKKQKAPAQKARGAAR